MQRTFRFYNLFVIFDCLGRKCFQMNVCKLMYYVSILNMFFLFNSLHFYNKENTYLFGL